MKKLLLFMLALGLLFSFPASAGEIDLSPTPAPRVETDYAVPDLATEPLLPDCPISLPCSSAILVEPETGTVIFELNADETCAVASVTKVMTILLALEAIDSGRVSPEDQVVISPESSGMGGSQALLDTGEVQTFSRLLECVVIASANDAAVAIAEHLYGSEELFVDQMNARARELGMENTVFANCTGLPAADQHTTARDVAIMTLAMVQHELYFEYSGVWMDELDHGDGRVTQLANTNKLLRRIDGCDGGKTGSTNEAGYCISATASRGGMRLVAVVLGSNSSADRFDAAGEMLEFGFANYRLYPVAEDGSRIRGELPVTGGKSDSVPLVLSGDLTLLVAKGTEQDISLAPDLPESVAAPVEAGSEVGSVNVLKGGRVVARIPVVAAESVPENGFFYAADSILKNWLFP